MGARLATLVLIFSFTLLNIYRAATQSITMDEAYTYLSFVKPTLAEILTHYDANHHVLHSLLCKASTGLFGVSELTLRLPSIAGGVLYFFSVLWICRLLLGDGWASVLCLSILILNPLVLDFSSVARGYSLGMGFLFLGVWGLLLQLREDKVQIRWRRLAFIGISLGLSISSVLTFVFPVAASLCMFAILTFSRGSRLYKQRLADLAALVVPAVTIAFVINFGPLSRATRDRFVIGFGSIFETLRNTLFHFLRHHSSAIGVWRWQIDPVEWLYPVCRVAVLLVLAVSAVFLLAHSTKRIRFLRSEAIFLSGVLIVTVTILVAAHRYFGILYPVARTAIYFVPLVVLTTTAILENLCDKPKLQLAWLPLSVLSGLLLVHFIMQVNMTYYNHWRFDAGTRDIARFLAAQTPAGRRTKIIASGTLVPCLNFYRETNKLRGWEPVEGPNGNSRLASADYVVIDPGDSIRISSKDLAPIFIERLSGAFVAVHR